MLKPREVFLFACFRLDRRNGSLFRRSDDGTYAPVSVGSRALEVLGALVERPGDLVSRDEIMRAVWPGTAVEEANLTVQISTLRRIIDEGRQGQSAIQTVPGRGYRFILSVVGEVEAPAPEMAQRRGRRAGAIVVGAVFLVMLLIFIGWRQHAPSQTPDRRLSAIVLPFENSSGDAAQDGVAVGLTRDITERLTRGGDGPIVPAATAETYRAKPWDLAAIGRKYDVHFVLTGSVRRQDGRRIVAAAIYDTRSGATVWGRQLDLADTVGGQSAIGQIIYENYWQRSIDAEAYRAEHEHPNQLDKRDLMMMALSTRLAAPTREHYREKIALVDRVVALDPNDRQGLERQARMHADFLMFGYSTDRKADLAIADAAADRLLMLDPNNLLTLRAKEAVLRATGDWSAAEALVRRVLAIQPTEAMRYYELGSILMAEGRHREALESLRTAKQFAGGADPVFLFDAMLAMAELATGRPGEARATALSAVSAFPPNAGSVGETPWLALIAATNGNGQEDAAREALRQFLTVPRIYHSMAVVQARSAYARNPILLDGLRRAGMPEG